MASRNTTDTASTRRIPHGSAVAVGAAGTSASASREAGQRRRPRVTAWVTARAGRAARRQRRPPTRHGTSSTRTDDRHCVSPAAGSARPWTGTRSGRDAPASARRTRPPPPAGRTGTPPRGSAAARGHHEAGQRHPVLQREEPDRLRHHVAAHDHQHERDQHHRHRRWHSAVVGSAGLGGCSAPMAKNPKRGHRDRPAARRWPGRARRCRRCRYRRGRRHPAGAAQQPQHHHRHHEPSAPNGEAASTYSSGRCRVAATTTASTEIEQRLRGVQPDLVAQQRLAQHAELEPAAPAPRSTLALPANTPGAGALPIVISHLPGTG